ncbi:hypothetical protein N7533_005775 [Penicillium manginii]|jgi:hypothetical protein|uniref:uncharacterized protein n=1 Tax=Penicillium manginii TaxID=203109 RepID=UPI0025486F62|nr:uncharacterized protein N7533_005775 [Penicillium manginii]KAJ5756232.1 hypothetical protein N7533_005775 [Penicillium manginii]
MAPKTIFLVGSPLPSSLDWENDELLDTALSPFHDSEIPDQNLNHCPQTSIDPDAPPESVKWRILQALPSCQPDHFHTTTFYYGPEDPKFWTTKQLVTTGDILTDRDSVLSDFYNHSFAVHEASEINASELEYIAQESGTAPNSMVSTISSQGENEEDDAAGQQTSFRMSGPIRDLQDIPTAKFLESIVPQTMTVNLIVGIIAIQPPRRVVTRQWKTELDIIEMVVGDETRTGFGINIWLPPERSAVAAETKRIDRLGRSLAMLRPQDIILLRTVGLSSFQNRVHGQTLRGGMTQVDLLHRRPVDMTDAGGFHDLLVDQPLLLHKARRVSEWVLQFVCATDEAGGRHSGMSTTHGHRLPPDTQQ